MHIYRIDMPMVTDFKPLEVAYLPGPGPAFIWMWSPQLTDIGSHKFVAAFDDELIYSLDLTGLSSRFLLGKDSAPQIDVAAPGGNWSGTVSLAWTGSGATTGEGASVESGTETVTYVAGAPSQDGVSFELVATEATFSATYRFNEPGATGACQTTRQYAATKTVTFQGPDADMLAHARLTVLPRGTTMADYSFDIPGLSYNVDYTDDTMSTCGIMTHNMGTVLLGATGTTPMGTIPRAGDTISGGTTYSARDGLFGEDMMYSATWDLHKM